MTLGGFLMKPVSFTSGSNMIPLDRVSWKSELNTPYFRRSRKVWFILFLRDLGLISNDSLAYARHIHWGFGV